jgi:predicted DNA-binding transcriptional regulator YafY
VHDQAGAVLLQFPSVALVEAVERQVPFDILRAINTAIRRRRVLRIRYQSLSRQQPAEHRFAPHTVVHNGFRWHVRGFSYGHGEYRDFVLMRFVGLPVTLEQTIYRGSDDDWLWNAWVRVQLAPHPGLSPSQRVMVMEDFGMEEGNLEIPTRGALVAYFLRVMGLAAHSGPADPALSPVIVANLGDLRPYLGD